MKCEYETSAIKALVDKGFSFDMSLKTYGTESKLEMYVFTNYESYSSYIEELIKRDDINFIEIVTFMMKKEKPPE